MRPAALYRQQEIEQTAAFWCRVAGVGAALLFGLGFLVGRL